MIAIMLQQVVEECQYIKHHTQAHNIVVCFFTHTSDAGVPATIPTMPTATSAGAVAT